LSLLACETLLKKNGSFCGSKKTGGAGEVFLLFLYRRI
jgi:hypothetical protein